MPALHPSHRRLLFATLALTLAAGVRLVHISDTPPGMHRDEAFHLLTSQAILRGEALPVYVTGNNGNEPLFAYLSTIALAILGPVEWAGRLTSAWIGLIGVALTVRAGNEMFPKGSVGWLAGLIMAAFYWHVTFSRFGIQPIIAATAAAGTIAALWNASRTGSGRAYTLAGLCLALGLGAYVAFRLFPLALLIAGTALWLTVPGKRLDLSKGGVLTIGVTALLYSPLALFFIQHPEWFFNRFSQTTEATLQAGNALAPVIDNAIRTVLGLFVHGDGNWRHNLPGRPGLDAAQAVFFVIGIAAGLRRWRHPEVWALLAWLVIGLSPSALTADAPHFSRTTMAVPAIALLAARGAEATWKHARQPATRVTIALALAASAASTIVDYFWRWSTSPALPAAFEADQASMARALRAAPDGAALYATPLQQDYNYEYQAVMNVLGLDGWQGLERVAWTMDYLLGPEASRRLSVFNGDGCTVLPAETVGPAVYAVNRSSDSRTLPALHAAYPQGALVHAQTVAGEPPLELYQIPAGETARLELGTARAVDFGGWFGMLGYTLPAANAQPGEALPLTVAWKTQRASEMPYKIFFHVIGPPKADGDVIYAQLDVEPCGNSYPTWQWLPGQLIVETYTLRLPADMPEADYYVQLGWYRLGSPGERLPAFDENGELIGDAVRLEWLRWGGEALADPLPHLTAALTTETAERIFGPPDEVTGSGLIVYIYHMPNGQKLRLAFPGAGPIVYAQRRSADGTISNLPLGPATP